MSPPRLGHAELTEIRSELRDLIRITGYPADVRKALVVLEPNLPPTRSAEMHPIEALDLLVKYPRHLRDPSFLEFSRERLRTVLEAVYEWPEMKEFSNIAVAACLFVDIDIGIFDGRLKHQVRLTRLNGNAGYIGKTIPAGHYDSRVTIGIGRQDCERHFRCRSNSCRLKTLLLCLIHEMSHAFIQVHCVDFESVFDADEIDRIAPFVLKDKGHGQMFLSIMGLAETKLRLVGCSLDLTQ